MADLLVKLYELPPLEPYMEALAQQNIVVRRPIGPENYAVISWIKQHFTLGWAGEAENAFFRLPKSMYIAVRSTEDQSWEMLGFGCWDATVKGFFGPTGVDEKERGKGIGAAILLSCLHAMKDDGYAYCIIGGAGDKELFYKKVCNAQVIEDSTPGIYKGMLYLQD